MVIIWPYMYTLLHTSSLSRFPAGSTCTGYPQLHVIYSMTNAEKIISTTTIRTTNQQQRQHGCTKLPPWARAQGRVWGPCLAGGGPVRWGTSRYDSWRFLLQVTVLCHSLHSVESVLCNAGQAYRHGRKGGNLQGVRERKAHL